jgi:V8-like Glu-specific endopeptidase
MALLAFALAMATEVAAQVTPSPNGTVTVTLPSEEAQLAAGIDYLNAKAMPLPVANILSPAQAEAVLTGPDPRQLFGQANVSPGDPGSGAQKPTLLHPRQQTVELQRLQEGGVVPQEFGTANQPYTTSRVNAAGDTTVSYYPFRAAGKLWFKIGADSYVCSASLIKPGIVVTAAHCVANFGKSQFYSDWRFAPAFNNGSAPYGVWTAKSATILTSYYNGTDPCTQPGVICQDDVAVITLNQSSGSYPGPATGWLAYGWNGYSYNTSGQALIAQLGYPVALDGGLLMQRTDSQGSVTTSLSNNTVIGSLMTGGSSGGSWVVNLGMPPTLSGTSFGTAANHDVVVGVTSWGYTNPAIKQQGASPFTTNNIVLLVNTVCAATPGAC